MATNKSEFIINPRTKEYLDSYITDVNIKEALIHHIKNAWNEGYSDGHTDGYLEGYNVAEDEYFDETESKRC